MKYLFIGGSLDGQKIDVGDSLICFSHDNHNYIDKYKRVSFFQGEGETHIKCFVIESMEHTAVLWRLLNNYKPKDMPVISDTQVRKFERDYRAITGKKLSVEALKFAMEELLK